ncbi:hypothetical protein [Croceitalea rosinachiae]|uniref:Uncharacterized protein n=1 Tax=Croceitalea rosinachiae TaxID=3075596 RepID=A0ABU3AFW9_9FLAO|nr:hypothetical protein [Croceitalea sp. F388]MDT0608008.1 hypothetical protein [Croceitalea sp. F388]
MDEFDLIFFKCVKNFQSTFSFNYQLSNQLQLKDPFENNSSFLEELRVDILNDFTDKKRLKIIPFVFQSYYDSLIKLKESDSEKIVSSLWRLSQVFCEDFIEAKMIDKNQPEVLKELKKYKARKNTSLSHLTKSGKYINNHHHFLDSLRDLEGFKYLVESASCIAKIIFHCEQTLVPGYTMYLQTQSSEPFKNLSPTTSQYAIYHYALQEFGAELNFIQIEKEIKIVCQKYGKNWKNFQMYYNKIPGILSNQSNVKFRIKDITQVEKMLKMTHPEILQDFNSFVSSKI